MQRILFVMVVVAGTVGCYQRIPLQATAAPPLGATVLIELSGRGADSIAPLVGPGVFALSGDVLEVREGELLLAMRTATDRRGIDTYWTREPVALDRSFIATMQERRLSRSKTILTAVGLTTGLFLITDAVTGFAGVVGSGGRKSTPGGS